MKRLLQGTILLLGLILLQINVRAGAGTMSGGPAVDSTIWCHALFSWYADSSNCQMIHFDDESIGSGTVTGWFWNFGDPASGSTNTSTAEHATHTFTAPGYYYIGHEITTSDGCSSSVHDTIYVAPPCNAEFHHQAATENPLHVHFWDDNMPPGSVKSWYWDFGDGTTSTNGDPWHVYAAPGDYTVCLHVTTWCDSTCYYCETITVEAPCVAEFEHQADSANPLHVHFWDPYMPSGIVAGYNWDFGDGTPMGTTPDPWHAYVGAGTYQVCLTIETIFGTTCDHCQNIEVGTTPCNAHYQFQQATENPLHVHFWDPNMPAGSVLSWLWTFGDGDSATTDEPWHIYDQPGLYNVCLYIATIYGTTCHYCDSIPVHATYDLDGYVTAGGDAVDHALVYLIRLDSVNSMTVIDTAEVSGNNGFYHFGGVYPGSYFTKAELLPSSAVYGDYVPTYHIDAIHWQYADTIHPGIPYEHYNIYMVHTSHYTSGSGTISGTISEGTKIASGGNPSPGVEVLLMDPTDNLLGYTITGLDGKFEFPAVNLSSYKVYPEFAGMTTIPATVTLDAANPSSELIFVIKGNQILLGIGGPATSSLNSVSEIYPNPASSHASIKIQTVRASHINLSVLSITGEAVQTFQLSIGPGANNFSWDISNLSNGVYFVRITDNEGGQAIRKLIVAE